MLVIGPARINLRPRRVAEGSDARYNWRKVLRRRIPSAHHATLVFWKGERK